MKTVVITVERLPLYQLGCYGNLWIDTPHIDRLATQSVVFHRNYAEDLSSSPTSHAWWTGKFESLHHAEGSGTSFQSPFFQLRVGNVRTCLVHSTNVESIVPVPPDLFSEVIIPAVEQTAGNEAGSPCVQEQVVQQAVEKLQELRSTDDWLLWVHLPGLPVDFMPDVETVLDDLESLELPEIVDWGEDELELGQSHVVTVEVESESDLLSDPVDELTEEECVANAEGEVAEDEVLSGLLKIDQKLRSRCRDDKLADSLNNDALQVLTAVCGGHVREFDRILGPLLDELQVVGDSEMPLVIFTAARGIALSPGVQDEHSRQNASHELAHTPLLLHLPGEENRGHRNCLTQSVDVLPTLLAWHGCVTDDEEWAGVNLLGACEDPQVKTRIHALLGTDGDSIGLISRDFFLRRQLPIEDEFEPEPELFLTPDDRWDVHDVSHEYLETVDEMILRLNEGLN